MREEALDRIILNENNSEEEGANPAIPFEVRYDSNHTNKINPSKGRKSGKSNSKIMVQITENNEISARKYMLDPSKRIYMGSKNGKNHIVVSDQHIDARQCEIIENGQNVYVHNIGGSGKLVLIRAGKKAYVESKYIELRSGDVLSIGETTFGIEVVRTKEK